MHMNKYTSLLFFSTYFQIDARYDSDISDNESQWNNKQNLKFEKVSWTSVKNFHHISCFPGRC